MEPTFRPNPYRSDQYQVQPSRKPLDPNAFASPPVGYRAVPFWSWNDAMTEDDVLRQIDEFHLAGIGGFYVHARPGIWTPFLSDEWFNLFRICLDRAKQLDMKVWIYDECSYPSGFAGGLVHEHNPNLAQQTLHCAIVDPNDDERKGSIARFWLFAGADGRVDYSAFHPDSRAPQANARLMEFYLVSHPGIPWLNGAPYIDVLHPDAARTFLNIAYEPYRERFHHEFGRVIPGVFTDEPHFEPFRSPGPGFLMALPWTPDLPEVFAHTYHEGLIDRLPELVVDTRHGYAHRIRFWRLLSSLFIERWVRPIYEWCDENGLLFTGHFWEHGFTPDYTGSIMLPTAWQHIPGVDLLGRDSLKDRQKWDLGERGLWAGSPEQMGNVAMIKAVTSVAHQTGRSRVMSETYGGAGWDLNFAKQKLIAEWQAVLGVNLLVPHLSHYSLRGERKHEHPPSFLGHQPWWNAYPAVHEYLSRLHYALAQGEYEAEVLVLHPMSSIWVGHRANHQPIEDLTNPDIVPSNLKERLKLDLDDLLKDLASAGWSHELGDELMLQELGGVEGSSLRVGQMTYDVAVLPPSINLLSSTYELLMRFLDAGGRVAAVSRVPGFIDGQSDERLTLLLKRCQIFADASELLSWLPSVTGRKARIDTADRSSIYTHVRRMEGERLVFAVNMGPSVHREAAVRIPVPSEVGERAVVERHDLRDGSVALLPASRVMDEELGLCMEVRVDFAVDESHLFLVRRERDEQLPASSHIHSAVVSGTSNVGRHAPLSVTGSALLGRTWQFKRLDPNALVLNRCSYQYETAEGQKTDWSVPSPIAAVKRLVRRRYGWPEITFREVQPWKKYAAAPPQPVAELTRLRFTVDVDFEPLAAAQLDLVVEEADEWHIEVNGHLVRASDTWWIDPVMRRIPVRSLLRQGENVIELARHFREDMSFEPIYLIGDFAARTHDMRIFRLQKESGLITAGSWVYQGYPFYAGRGLYRQDVEIQGDDRVWLEISDLPATATRVRVNGHDAGTLAWEPYRVEITQWARRGRNAIELEVVNSLRNLFGPHHRSGPIPLVTPGHWYYDGSASSELSVVPDGLANEVRLIYGR